MRSILILALLSSTLDAAPDYSKDIAPILQKYCAGCHNDDDREGKLSLESFTSLQKGGENGATLLPGDSKSSRLIRVLTGEAKPKMPPKDEKAPTVDEIALLKEWVDAGAKGPNGAEPQPSLLVPSIKPAKSKKPITAIALSPNGELIAIAHYGEVQLALAKKDILLDLIEDLPGKVNSIEFSADGKLLVASSGVAGLRGEAMIWNVAAGELNLVQKFQGHRDTVYAATLTRDGKTLATSSYDKTIILWDVATGKKLRTLSGHNGAVYDVAFDPTGQILASASGDETVKIWRVDTGLRLDTRSQPLAEQFVVTFSPDGKYLVAGGADNRIRVWKIIEKSKPAINPLIYARFAHEGPIVDLAFSSDGKALLSTAEDRSLKLWETKQFSQVKAFEQQSDVAVDLAIAPNSKSFYVARMDGSLQPYEIGSTAGSSAATQDVVKSTAPMDGATMQQIVEKEPNDLPNQAADISLPATISGVIHSTNPTPDADVFRFESKAGQEWMIEVNAARSKSPLDSRVEVLNADGERIERVLLEAVRDSYFTFRGKDSNTINDFRVHNWEEMELNEYLYANGEVSKLWLYPRGPDSGFKVYPGTGNRYGFFDTTPIAHALNSPCFIVRPHAPGTKLIPSGLPVFPIYFENDDDSRRELGTDSRLTFTAPSDGKYLVRLVDSRGFQGEKFTYKLTIRPRQPDFTVSVGGMNPKISPGSGREFSVKAKRIDGFDGPIQVEIDNVPVGFHVTTPIVIQAGQNTGLGTISASTDAAAPVDDKNNLTEFTASAEIHGKSVAKKAGSLGKIQLADKPKVVVRIEQAGAKEPQDWTVESPLALEIQPGQTIMAKVRVERNGFKDRISFGNEDSGRNLPHGVYVDNIGLNGLLIVEGKTERNFFITAAKWVPETTRTFHLQARVDGNQTSLPVVLHVRGK